MAEEQGTAGRLRVWAVTDVTDPSWNLPRQERSHNRQATLIVAARSKAAALRALQAVSPNMTRYYLDGWGSETGNEEQLATALAAPGTVFARALDWREPDGWRALRASKSLLLRPPKEPT